jgi:hypothetical protein
MNTNKETITLRRSEYDDLLKRLAFAEGALRGLGLRMHRAAEVAWLNENKAMAKNIADDCEEIADEVGIELESKEPE